MNTSNIKNQNRSFLILLLTEIKLTSLNFVIILHNFFINIINSISSIRNKDSYIIPLNYGNNTIYESTSLNRIRFSPQFELFLSRGFIILSIITITTYVITYTYTNAINNSLMPESVYQEQYLANLYLWHDFYRSVTLDLFKIVKFIVFFAILLMSISMFRNINRKEEDRHFLIIGIDVFYFFDWLISGLISKEDPNNYSVSRFAYSPAKN